MISKILIAVVVLVVLIAAYFIWIKANHGSNGYGSIDGVGHGNSGNSINIGGSGGSGGGAGDPGCKADADCGPTSSCVAGACVPGIVLTVTAVNHPTSDGSLLVTGYTSRVADRGEWVGKPVTIQTKSLGDFKATVTRTFYSANTPPNFVTLKTEPGVYVGSAVYAASPLDSATIMLT
jgi:hypothetical protein